jgi:hypothetical protein
VHFYERRSVHRRHIGCGEGGSPPVSKRRAALFVLYFH